MNFPKENKLVYAIDFGTSNSLIAATDGLSCSEPLPLDRQAQDPSLFRTLLYFPNEDECFYGAQAKEEYTLNQFEGRFIRSIKKFLPSQSYRGTWIENRVVKLEDLIGLFLKELKTRADKFTGQNVESVVLGRPVQFSPDPADDKLAQFRLEKAAQMAGFKNIEFFPEPLAAAYSMKGTITEEKIILIVDLGGGTSDFTILKVMGSQEGNHEVLALDGVPVAGDAIDGHFMQHKLAPFFGLDLTYRVPLGNNILTMPRGLLGHLYSPADLAQMRHKDIMHFYKDIQKWALKAEDKKKINSLLCLVEDNLGFQIFEEIEKTKVQLSYHEETEFVFQYPDIDIQTHISRHDYENYIEETVGKIINTLENTMETAQIASNEVDYVYCTGGTSKLPLIKRHLKTIFGEEKLMRNKDFHSVIQGLCERAKEVCQ